MGQPRAKTGANLRPNRANIGQQQQQQQNKGDNDNHNNNNTNNNNTNTNNNNNNLGPRQGQTCAQIGPTSANNNNNKKTTTTTTTTTTPEHGHGLHPTHTFHGSALAGARLSGVSLINPGAGPGAVPVALPEAFGGNRRLYTAAAPAADRLCPIPVHGCPIPAHGCPIPPHPRSTIIVVIYSVFCVWCSKNIVFYRVLWPSPSPGFILATLKNHRFFMILGLRQGSGTENWTS